MQLLSRRGLPIAVSATLVLAFMVAFRIDGSAVEPQLYTEAQVVEAPPASRYSSRLALHFDAQGRDADWSRKAESTLQAKLGGNESADVQLRSVDCRTTICRMEFEHDGSGATLAMIDAITRMLPDVVAEPPQSSSGRHSLVMYIARDDLRSL